MLTNKQASTRGSDPPHLQEKRPREPPALYLLSMCSVLKSFNDVCVKKKVNQSRYTPWRRLGGEEV
jgi:hypothetical protein